MAIGEERLYTGSFSRKGLELEQKSVYHNTANEKKTLPSMKMKGLWIRILQDFSQKGF